VTNNVLSKALLRLEAEGWTLPGIDKKNMEFMRVHVSARVSIPQVLHRPFFRFERRPEGR